jgi:hypothetical protein
LAQQGSPSGHSPRQPSRHGFGQGPRLDDGRRQARSARPRRVARDERPVGLAGWDDSDTELPPWAGPGIYPARASSSRVDVTNRTWTRRPAAARPEEPDEDYSGDEGYEHVDAWQGEERPSWPDDAAAASELASPAPPPRRVRLIGRRAAAARLRRSRRRVYVWAGVAIVASFIAAAIAQQLTGHAPARLPYVTALQRGEFKSVPDACRAIGPTVLNQVLPATGRTSLGTVASATDSACTFTVDRRPNFLVLSVEAEAYQPFPAASGNGSASDTAHDQFLADRQLLAHPPKRSPLPPAQITLIGKLGSQAFQAVALEHAGHISTDVVTVMILDHNVITSIQLAGQESGGGFGPVSLSTLEAGAQSVARSVLSEVVRQPTA